jgi:hypothetical protein
MRRAIGLQAGGKRYDAGGGRFAAADGHLGKREKKMLDNKKRGKEISSQVRQ